MSLTLYDIATNLMAYGVAEVPGQGSNPLIEWMHSTCPPSNAVDDEIPWCSSGLNGLCVMAGCDRSHSRLARSWLKIGRHVTLSEARIGWDIVVLRRGAEWQGHVGLFAGYFPTQRGQEVSVLGCNQHDRMSIASFAEADVLDVRRLA